MPNRFENIEWRWWTSNSWRRLTEHNKRTGESRQDGNVLCPTRASDGHPDIIVSPENMAAIEALPELYTACLKLVRSGNDPESQEWNYKLLNEALKEAEAALAKADRRTI